jgi:aromatic-amino-acid transaminase
MNDAHLFGTLDAPEPDEILRSNQAFAADPRAHKVNLGIGMYYDASGRVPLMRAVSEAQRRIVDGGIPWPYGPALGSETLRAHLAALVFGEGTPVPVSAQTLGGTGALGMGATLLAEAIGPDAVVALSTPSWPNHAPIFARAGFTIRGYRYLDDAGTGFDREGMLADLAALPRGSVVVLHAGCHNPTGVDPAPEDWPAIVEILRAHGLIAFVDAAYLGFGAGWPQDCAPIRLVRDSGVAMLFSLSCSKSFSLYGERTGCLMIPHQDDAAARGIAAHAAAYARTQYSIPPGHGARIVEVILGDEALRADWLAELETMRGRIIDLRHALVSTLAAEGLGNRMGHLGRQHGLFSQSGLTRAQVARLAAEHAIHAIPDGRICIAALNEGNLGHVARAMAEVCRH